MDEINRRKFLKLVGAGSGAIAAGVMLPTAGLSGLMGRDLFAFRAVGGLPAGPIPSYATYVLEGHVNPLTLSGVITRTVFAGPPEAMSTIALPGLSRVIRVDGVRDLGSLLHVRGVVEDRSQLSAGESATMDLRIDRGAGVAHASFFRSMVPLRFVSA